MGDPEGEDIVWREEGFAGVPFRQGPQEQHNIVVEANQRHKHPSVDAAPARGQSRLFAAAQAGNRGHLERGGARDGGDKGGKQGHHLAQRLSLERGRNHLLDNRQTQRLAPQHRYQTRLRVQSADRNESAQQ